MSNQAPDMLTTLRNEMNASRTKLHGMVGGTITAKAAAEQQINIMARRIVELENRVAELECQLEQADAIIAADDRMLEDMELPK